MPSTSRLSWPRSRGHDASRDARRPAWPAPQRSGCWPPAVAAAAPRPPPGLPARARAQAPRLKPAHPVKILPQRKSPSGPGCLAWAARSRSSTRPTRHHGGPGGGAARWRPAAGRVAAGSLRPPREHLRGHVHGLAWPRRCWRSPSSGCTSSTRPPGRPSADLAGGQVSRVHAGNAGSVPRRGGLRCYIQCCGDYLGAPWLGIPPPWTVTHEKPQQGMAVDPRGREPARPQP